MKKLILFLAATVAISLSSCDSQAKKETNKLGENTTLLVVNDLNANDITFGVRGNCSMCKNAIEKAAKSIKGVSKAVWNVDEKYIDVSFDPSQANDMDIHKAIAASGYDTEKVMGSLDAYDNLPGCCKYDHEMEMNQFDKKTEKAPEIALEDYKLDIEGMMCGYCSGKTTAELRKLPWIKDLKVSHDNHLATFNVVSGAKVNETELATAIRDIGFKPENLTLKGAVVSDIAKVNSNPKNTKYIYRVQIWKTKEDADFNKITKKLKKVDSKIKASQNEEYGYAFFYSNTKIPFITLHEAALDAGFLAIKTSENEDKWMMYDVVEKEGFKNYTISRVAFSDNKREDAEKMEVILGLIFKGEASTFTREGMKLYNKNSDNLDFDAIEKKLQIIFPNLSELQIGAQSKKYEAKKKVIKS